MTWATSVTLLVFLGLDLGPMYATAVRRASSLNYPYPRGGGIIIIIIIVPLFNIEPYGRNFRGAAGKVRTLGTEVYSMLSRGHHYFTQSTG